MTRTRWTGAGRLYSKIRISILLTVLAVAMALGMTAARATSSASVHTAAPSLRYHSTLLTPNKRTHRPAGQWILDDKGGWVYVRYGP